MGSSHENMFILTIDIYNNVGWIAIDVALGLAKTFRQGLFEIIQKDLIESVF